MLLKMSSAKLRPFCLGPNVLKLILSQNAKKSRYLVIYSSDTQSFFNITKWHWQNQQRIWIGRSVFASNAILYEKDTYIFRQNDDYTIRTAVFYDSLGNKIYDFLSITIWSQSN